jgi:hypothetical protein
MLVVSNKHRPSCFKNRKVIADTKQAGKTQNTVSQAVGCGLSNISHEVIDRRFPDDKKVGDCRILNFVEHPRSTNLVGKSNALNSQISKKHHGSFLAT